MFDERWLIPYDTAGIRVAVGVVIKPHGAMIVPAYHWFVWTSTGSTFFGGVN